MQGSSRHSKTFSDLEWGRILEKVASMSACSLGAELCREVELAVSMQDVADRMAETTEARTLLSMGVEIPFGGLRDVRQVIHRIRKDARLDAAELIAMGETLSVSRRMRNAVVKNKQAAPSLVDMAGSLISVRGLEKEILSCFDAGGNVADNASPELRQLRKKERSLHQTISDSLNRFIVTAQKKELLQEDLYTVRNGRYVVPVRVEKKSKVEGIVHDMSGSGQSIYIEPREITELNNLLRTAELEIEQEIWRIFTYLASKLAERIDDIELSLEILASFDFIFARARYSIYLKANQPKINDEGIVDLRSLRHPLLVQQGEEVIANDLKVGEEFQTLVVTGPNMGGKTVNLKAVGLCALMIRAGLHLPVDEGSRMALFDRVFTDIGDEQSIEHNLSSFSARILNLKEMFEELSEKSLVLLDEVGEGTDPVQGQAIAQAVLEQLQRRRAVTIVTTHFRNLTALAYRNKGFANASVEFDNDTMRPTYRFLQGVPGRSNALNIAKRLKMDEAVTNRTGELLVDDSGGMEDVLRQMDEERRRYAKDAAEISALRRQTGQLKDEQDKILRDLKKQRAKMEEDMASEVRRDLSRARTRIREALTRVRTENGPPTARNVAVAQAELRKVEEDVQDKDALPAGIDPSSLKDIVDWEKMQVGDELYVLPVRAMGKLAQLPDAKGRVTVQVRGSRLTLPASKLRIRSGGRAHGGMVRKTQPIVVESAKDEPVRKFHTKEQQSCDLRGMYREDALGKVEGFLDAALRAGAHHVYIIHGHGTGVLKKEVRQYLSGSSYVLKYRPGEKGEGGDGATYVELAL